MSQIPVITIDGPSGSGKGTLSSMIANHLKWHFLDSGAIYRVLAFAALQNDLALDNASQLAELAQQLPVLFLQTPALILLDGQEISQLIRTEAIGNAASKLAVHPLVRQALVARQQAFRTWPGLVADGRDMGTVIFPDASLKIFLQASPKTRAIRRHAQLKSQGLVATIDDLINEMLERDARDSQRAVSPQVAAPDALIIDTTHLSVEAVFEQVLGQIRTRGLLTPA